ncbi:hypothetical protein EFP19_08940 [Burkholderia glumae]|nr:hypothetical protein Y5A_001320 [Burkholderia glumae AU6208]UVS95867.1 hypothetical protein EFP19_08940 [Burkholderia glumae]
MGAGEHVRSIFFGIDGGDAAIASAAAAPVLAARGRAWRPAPPAARPTFRARAGCGSHARRMRCTTAIPT